jgi:predicted O-methyltransferase YrrM
VDIIPELTKSFDLVFIDADKSNYETYLELLLPKLTSGAVILSDNVLWSGKVVEKVNPKDIDTKALLQYNKILKEHPKLETVLLPIRDGLTISRVK